MCHIVDCFVPMHASACNCDFRVSDINWMPDWNVNHIIVPNGECVTSKLIIECILLMKNHRPDRERQTTEIEKR